MIIKRLLESLITLEKERGGGGFETIGPSQRTLNIYFSVWVILFNI